jgi:DSF synthase
MNAPARHADPLEAQFSQVDVRFDASSSTIWAYMNPAPRACYTETMLHELRAFEQMLEVNAGRVRHAGESRAVRHMVLASKIPGIYNLGGDLNRFKRLIQEQDRDGLLQYARQCIDVMWSFYRHFECDLSTIALVQGQALGGGFEGALPADVIIAEESATFGLPEVLFNLFPGMGALSFLSRKIGMRGAEEVIYSGASYSARQMADRGIVDVVVPDGEGEKAVHDWIARHSRTAAARRLVNRAKQLVNPVTYDELLGITTVWVDGALNLTLRDLRIMDRLVAAQNRRHDATPAVAETAHAMAA